MLSPDQIERRRLPVLFENDLPQDAVFPCDTCDVNDTCEFAWDVYNLDTDQLDCLGAK